MKKLLAIAVLLAAAMSAQAKVGDTLPQLIRRFGSNYDTEYHSGMVTHRFEVDKGTVTIVMQNGVCMLESYFTSTSNVPLVNGEPPTNIVRGILEVESPKEKWHEVKLPWFNYGLETRNGSLIGGLYYARNSWLLIVGYPVTVMSFAGWAAGGSAASAPTFTPPPLDSIEPTPVPALTPQDHRTPNDCAIIAAEAYAKLKSVTYWCQIMAIEVDTATEKFCHAMVFFKIDTSGRVMVYDARGTQELNTTSEDPRVLARATTYSMWTLTGSYPERIVLLPLTYDQAQTYQPAAIKTTTPSTPAPGLTSKQLNDFAGAVGYLMGWVLIKLLIGGGIGYAIGKSKNLPWFGFWWGFALGLVGWIVTFCMRTKRPLPA